MMCINLPSFLSSHLDANTTFMLKLAYICRFVIGKVGNTKKRKLV